MRIEDFEFELPAELIAQTPPAERGSSRLLHLPGAWGALHDLVFTDLPGLLGAGDLLVVNDTRVVKARLFARKSSGGRVEVLIERALGTRRCIAHVRASRAPRVGSSLSFGDGYLATILDRHQGLFELEFEPGADLSRLMALHGSVPLPPYIQRPADPQDEERYQTVYAQRPGAAAAPTAGLHFDDAMLNRLQEQGVNVARITLHVGAGTFQPVRVEDIEEHVMHTERVVVGQPVCDAVKETRDAGGRVVAVGTTCVRALESASSSGVLQPFDGDTRLFIRPGYRFISVDAMITNFHLSRSTLLMLVSAFAGRERILDAYHHAIAAGYRFFSYGDAMFIERSDV
ncbi:MAG: S-adenosylmethionine:tRNA ribosyltransferase-isomerase [Gammaproteobacteria bacterium]|jgi:S-adenosylmethionine:tRNA ribosyltransferase-isomerase